MPVRAIDDNLMHLALDEAHAAPSHGDVPIGCVITRGSVVIARAHNEREKSNDPTAHAEILALRAAAAEIGSWRLEGCTVYVTLEPCAMCAGAMVLARVQRLVIGAPDPKAGAAGSIYDIPRDPRLNHRFEVVSGILATECGDVLREFFAARRGIAEPS